MYKLKQNLIAEKYHLKWHVELRHMHHGKLLPSFFKNHLNIKSCLSKGNKVNKNQMRCGTDIKNNHQWALVIVCHFIMSFVYFGKRQCPNGQQWNWVVSISLKFTIDVDFVTEVPPRPFIKIPWFRTGTSSDGGNHCCPHVGVSGGLGRRSLKYHLGQKWQS